MHSHFLRLILCSPNSRKPSKAPQVGLSPVFLLFVCLFVCGLHFGGLLPPYEVSTIYCNIDHIMSLSVYIFSPTTKKIS